MEFISVEIASRLINQYPLILEEEKIPFEKSTGRVLREDILADRDFPPFDRVTMDGIALHSSSYLKGQRVFPVQGIQYAGEPALTLENENMCIEVMTGTPLPKGADTVIRYEDLEIVEGNATLQDQLPVKRNIHGLGSDRRKGEIILKKGAPITVPDLAILATVGKPEVLVSRLPSVSIVTSGDELVEVHQTPLPHQIRRSNVYAIAELIKPFSNMVSHSHIADNLDATTSELKLLLEKHDVIILSGGVSAGKKDFIPQALENIGFEMVFHKIAQRPGKPMWFGRKENKLVFALPGNPVSAFMCAVKYVKPWFQKCMGLAEKPEYAFLGKNVNFKPNLSYFMQVKLQNEKGKLIALPEEGHGSGDLANLSNADAFLELPQKEESLYEKGEVFRVWRF